MSYNEVMPTKWTTGLLIIFLIVVATLSGYNYLTRPYADVQLFSSPVQVSPTPVVQPSPTPISAAEIVASMQPEEKIAQLLVLPLTASASAQSQLPTGSASAAVAGRNSVVSAQDLVPAGQQQDGGQQAAPKFVPGGYLIVDANLSMSEVQTLFARPEVAGPITQAVQTRPLRMVDHEGGSVQRLSGEGFTQMPSWQELCALPKGQRISILQASARELAAVGIDMVLAPVLDVAESHPILTDRVCAADTTLTLLAATDYTRTFSEAGVLPVFKHFPGIGNTTYDLHKRFDSVQVDANELGLFRTMLDSFPAVPVMVSHVGVANQFADVPCSLSQSCVGELLQSYPDRVVITDALDMAAVRNSPGLGRLSLADAALDAVAAGNTLLLLGERVTSADQQAVWDALLTEYQTNASFASKVDEAARKVVTLKLLRLER